MPARGLGSLGVAALLLGCGGEGTIEAPRPVAQAAVPADTALSLLPSVLDFPVEYDLGPALAWLDSVVPRQLGDVDARLGVAGNDRLEFAYSAERSPFRLTLDGTTATLSAAITYRGRGWYNPPILPTITGSCGLEEDAPRAFLAVRTSITPSEDWLLRSRTRVAELRPLTTTRRDRCTVTVAEVNVTDRILEAVQGLLNTRLGRVDRQLAEFELREMVENVWAFLAAPIALQDSLWLVIDPAAIRFDKVRSEGTVLHSSLGITAYPRVVSGARPQVQPRPLPDMERRSAPPGLSLLSEAAIDWTVLTGLLQQELVGDTIDVAGRRPVIAGINVSGLADGRVAVGLQLRGAARGTVYLVGHPVFDPVDAVLSMPDLEFDVSSRNLMVRGLAWLASGQVEADLRRNLRLSLGGLLEDGRALLERELSRELAPGVQLSTRVDRGQVVRVRARPQALLLDVVVSGEAEMRLVLAPGRVVGSGPGG